jgi:hypothetical protein
VLRKIVSLSSSSSTSPCVNLIVEIANPFLEDLHSAHELIFSPFEVVRRSTSLIDTRSSLARGRTIRARCECVFQPPQCM